MKFFECLQQYFFYRRSQYWSRGRLEAYQDRQLRRVIRHAGKHVPYYRALFNRIGLDPETFRGRQDLQRIPVLTKQSVRTRTNELTADNCERFGVNHVSTSGTTGTPLKLTLSDSTVSNFLASLLRCYHWSGYRFFTKTLSLQSYYFEKQDLQAKRLYNVLRFDSCRLSRESAIRAIATINREKPRFFMGFPFDLVMLTKYASEAGLAINPPDSVLCYGETLSSEKRRILEDRLKCKVYDFYSHHESVAMAAECEHGSMHLMDDFAYHELVNEKGEETAVEEGRELVGTGLYNLAMPLIRYCTGDKVRLDRSQAFCPCGRNLRTVMKIIGKQADYLKTPDGRVLGAVMSHSIDEAKGVVMSQCIQESIDRITINVVTDDTYDQDSEIALRKGLRKRLGDEVKLDISKVERLEKSKLGKTPFIISRIGCEYH